MPSNYEGRVLCFAPDELDEIEPLFPGAQSHRERREIENLVHSIGQRRKVLEPGCFVRKDGKIRLVFGCRRLAATKMHNMLHPDRPVKFWAWEWDDTEEEAREAMLDENDGRLRLTDPIDVAHELRFLTGDCGMDQRAAEQRLGETESRGYQLTFIFKLPAPVIEAIERGELCESNARELGGLSERAARKLFDRFRRGEINGVTMAELARQAKRKKDGKATQTPGLVDIGRYLLTLPRLGLILREIKDGNVRIEALTCIDRGMSDATDRYVWEHFRIDLEAA